MKIFTFWVSLASVIAVVSCGGVKKKPPVSPAPVTEDNVGAAEKEKQAQELAKKEANQITKPAQVEAYKKEITELKTKLVEAEAKCKKEQQTESLEKVLETITHVDEDAKEVLKDVTAICAATDPAAMLASSKETIHEKVKDIIIEIETVEALIKEYNKIKAPDAKILTEKLEGLKNVFYSLEKVPCERTTGSAVHGQARPPTGGGGEPASVATGSIRGRTDKPLPSGGTIKITSATDPTKSVTATVGADGTYSATGVSQGVCTIDVLDAEGKVVASQTHVVGASTNDVNLSIPEACVTPGKATIKVKNATTGAVMAGVDISIKNNVGQSQGDGKSKQDGTLVTASTLPAGFYRVTASSNGFISGQLSLRICGDVTKEITLSPLLNDGAHRIVMTWTDEKPNAARDVDSYLKFDNTKIFYENKNKDGSPNLDVDNMNWTGPETITISQLDPGKSYEYYVCNYSDRDAPGALGNSEVTVTVYKGQNPIYTKSMPRGSGLRYNFFNFANGSLKDVGRFQDSCD